MKSDISNIFEKITNLDRWKIFADKRLEFSKNPLMPVEAQIDNKWKKIKIKVHEDLDKIVEYAVQDYNIEGLFDNPLYDMLYSLMIHEEGHWKYCPFDAKYFEDMFSGTYEGLKIAGYQDMKYASDNEKGLFISAWRACLNMFEDLIVDTSSSALDKDSYISNKGHLIVDLIYSNSPLNIPTLTDSLYKEVHARLAGYPLELYAPLVSTLGKIEKDHEEMIFKLIKTIARKSELSKKLSSGLIDDDEKRRFAKKISDPRDQKWYDMSKDFASIMGRYFRDDQEDIRQNSKGSQFVQVMFGDTDKDECQDYLPEKMIEAEIEGQYDGQKTEEEMKKKNEEKTGKRDKKDKAKKADSLEEKIRKNKDKKDENKGSEEGKNKEKKDEEKRDKEDNKKEKRLNPKFLKEMIRIGTEKGREINYAERLDYLDVLYERRADKIIIDLIDKKKDSLTTRIVDLTREIVTPENINLKRIQWSRTRLLNTRQEKKMQLYQGNLALDVDDPETPARNNIPDIALIVDSSGSMRSDIIKGDEGPYDLLLRANYALFNWLKRTGKGYQMKFSAINFSWETYFSGWQDYKDMDKVKEELLRFQDGGTVLDPKVIKRLYSERQDPFLAILTTDGSVEYPEETADELKRLVEYGNDLAIIHIEGDYSEYDTLTHLLKDHAQIHKIKDPHDLIGLKLGYAQKYWGNI